MYPVWEDPAAAEENVAFARNADAAMKRRAAGRVYPNFIGDEGPARIAEAFGPEKFRRLRRLKGVGDPDNVFRHNHKIPPL
ncbi:BBE domain-containing protein [Arthrobacter mobilis]|uniref:Berberine/berberine-like domain-containing protein n=1 Tax=Arthrobacter mobilis TaxID=2724944 RepID=A0A7X6HC19_9MICC|nr:BBE domain-containing protein [Arthrobacter mobilis]NKX53373.1 hypothetical protein [Arthrobacter mobilis]